MNSTRMTGKLSKPGRQNGGTRAGLKGLISSFVHGDNSSSQPPADNEGDLAVPSPSGPPRSSSSIPASPPLSQPNYSGEAPLTKDMGYVGEETNQDGCEKENYLSPNTDNWVEKELGLKEVDLGEYSPSLYEDIVPSSPDDEYYAPPTKPDPIAVDPREMHFRNSLRDSLGPEPLALEQGEEPPTGRANGGPTASGWWGPLASVLFRPNAPDDPSNAV